jgi:hypothetical protein
LHRFTELFPNKSLSDSKIKLKTYSGEKIKVEGECQIEVKYNRKSYRLKLLNEQGSPLMGRDWLMKIPLDWKKITCLNLNKIYQTNDELSKLLNKYEKVFSESPGKSKGVTGNYV